MMRAIPGAPRRIAPARLPPTTAGLRVGLFGGSFNPPHDGHRLVTLAALKRLRLDRVWWLVTPGNPLKDNRGLPSLQARMAACRALMRHPRVEITGLEADIGTRFSFDTIDYLVHRRPDVQFIWIMGADNLASFHRWQRWRDIADLVPMAVIDRPGSTLRAASARAARRFAGRRLEESDASLLATAPPPAWLFLHGPRSALSSTRLRANGVMVSSQSED